MKSDKLAIKYTIHAGQKAKERKVTDDMVKRCVLEADIVEKDKFDESLSHFIKKIHGRFLRVIGRWENEETLTIISVFFDRRLLRRFKND